MQVGHGLLHLTFNLANAALEHFYRRLRKLIFSSGLIHSLERNHVRLLRSDSLQPPKRQFFQLEIGSRSLQFSLCVSPIGFDDPQFSLRRRILVSHLGNLKLGQDLAFGNAIPNIDADPLQIAGHFRVEPGPLEGLDGARQSDLALQVLSLRDGHLHNDRRLSCSGIAPLPGRGFLDLRPSTREDGSQPEEQRMERQRPRFSQPVSVENHCFAPVAISSRHP